MPEEDEGSYSRVLDSVTKIVSVYLEKNDGLNPEQVVGLVDGILKVLARDGDASTLLSGSVGGGASGSAGGTAAAEPAAAKEPAVPVSESITPDYLVCLEDGRKVKLLKPYLNSKYGLSPRQYREKWGLAKDYPMVAPAYSEKRTAIARASGLGARGVRADGPAETAAAPEEAPAVEAKPASRRSRGAKSTEATAPSDSASQSKRGSAGSGRSSRSSSKKAKTES